MAYLLYWGTILYNLINREGKKVAIFSFCVMWVMMGWSSGNIDYNKYVVWYNNYQVANKEILYTVLEYFAHQLGFSYAGFLIVMSGICIVVRIFLIYRLSNSPGFVIALYMMFPFPQDITQIRMFYGATVVLWGIQYLLSEKWVTIDAIKYVICIIVGTCIQSGCIVFILLLLCKVNIKRMWIIVFSGMALEYFIFKSENMVLKIAGMIGLESKVQSALNNSANYAAYRFVWRAYMMIIGCFMLIFLVDMQMKIRSRKGVCDEEQFVEYMKMSDFVKKINLIIFMIVPVYRYSIDLHRIFYHVLIFTWISISNSLLPRRKSWKICIGNLIVIFLCFLCGIIYLYFNVIRTYFDNIWFPMFQNNRLLQ